MVTETPSASTRMLTTLLLQIVSREALEAGSRMERNRRLRIYKPRCAIYLKCCLAPQLPVSPTSSAKRRDEVFEDARGGPGSRGLRASVITGNS
jgi:hypothetical protein